MADLAELGVKVDSKGAVKGSQESERAIKRIGDASQRYVGEKGAAAFDRMGKAIGATAAALVALSVGNLIRTSISQFADFQQSAADLSAITGATGQNLKFLSDAALEMGRTTTLSASQAAQAFTLIASAKPDLLDNLQALKDTTQATIVLAEAAGLDLPTAANSLGQALNQFGADADQATRFINVLAAGAKFGSSQIDQTSAALVNAGTAAYAAGVSFEQTNAALQVLAKNGVVAERAGTALRAIFLDLSTKLDSSVTPNVAGLGKSLESLKPVQNDIKTLAKIFGDEYANVAQVLIKNTDLLDELTAKLTGTNIAFEQQHTRTDTLTGDLKALASAWEGLKITTGATFEDISRKGVQELTKIINVMTDILIRWEFATTQMDFLWGKVLRSIESASLTFFDDLFYLILPGPIFEKFEKEFNKRRDELLQESKDAVAKFALDVARIMQRLNPPAPAAPTTITITGGAEAGGGGLPPRPPPGKPETRLLIEKALEAQRLLDEERKEAIRIIEDSRTAEEKMNVEIGRTLQLANQFPELFTDDDLIKAIDHITDKYKEMGVATEKTIDNSTQAIIASIDAVGSAVEDVFVDAVLEGQFSFEEFSKAIIADIVRITAKLLIVKPLIESITKALTEKPAGGGLFGGGGSSGVFGFLGSLLTFIPGFQAGGEFSIPGTGPKLTPIVAHGGERVTVQTPEQQRNDNVRPNISLTFNLQSLDPSNAATVVRQTLPQLQGEIVGIVNQSYNVRGKRGPVG